MSGSSILSWLLLALAAGATGYSLIALFAVSRFIRYRRKAIRLNAASAFTPPVSVLKPLYGADRELEKNLESFFRQAYPSYEIIFSVREEMDAAVPIVRSLQKRFPQTPARLVFTGPPRYLNAKVHGLEAMMEAAAHEILVINDSGVRVEPDYLRSVVRPLADPSVGLVTCVAREVPSKTLWSRMEALCVNTQYFGGILAAWVLLGMEFSLGKTMATRKEQVRRLGGFGALGDYLADDFVLGERMAREGFQVVLSATIPENRFLGEGMRGSLAHRLRWERSTRHSRPTGYLGQIFMHNLPLALLAWACAPSESFLAAGVVAACLASRALLASALAALVLRDPAFRKDWWLLPLQDLVSFGVWLGGFSGREILWRGTRFRVLRGGRLEPAVNGTQETPGSNVPR